MAKQTMNARERERFYDKQIAPELRRLGLMCQDAGLSMVCVVEFARDKEGYSKNGQTTTLAKERSGSINMLDMLARSHGNIDAFTIAVARWVRETNAPHSSIVLGQMGVEPDPTRRTQDTPYVVA